MAKKIIDGRSLLIAALAAAILAFTLLGYRFYADRDQQAAIGGHFSLTDQNGRQVVDSDFHGKYMLVYFGYTACPDICPLTLQAISDALNRLGEKAKAIQPIFITVDPDHDTPSLLKEYMANFRPGFIALTGDKAAIQATAAAFRVYYAPNKEPGLIDHSSVIYVLDKNGRYLTHFSANAKAEEIWQGLNLLS